MKKRVSIILSVIMALLVVSCSNFTNEKGAVKDNYSSLAGVYVPVDLNGNVQKKEYAITISDNGDATITEDTYQISNVEYNNNRIVLVYGNKKEDAFSLQFTYEREDPEFIKNSVFEDEIHYFAILDETQVNQALLDLDTMFDEGILDVFSRNPDLLNQQRK